MRRRRPAALAALVGVVLIASCGSDGDGGDGGGSDSVGARLADDPGTVAVDQAPDIPAGQLPPGTEPMWSVELDSAPRLTEERLVGLVYPDAAESDLSIVGLDTTGSTRWRITTNPSCAGFGVTRHDGRDLVIILDSDAELDEGKVATRTTASAFNADDGALVWGPVDVPGPLRGPGLIFGASPGSIVADEVGPVTMLSVADGSVVADESEGDVVYYEYRGVGVYERAGELQARDTASGDLLWTGADIDRPAGARPGSTPRPVTDTAASDGDTIVLAWRDRSGEAAAGDASADGAAADDAAAGDAVYAIHDLRTGAVHGRLPGWPDGTPVLDPETETTLVTGSGPDGRRLTATRPGGRLWSIPFPDDASADVVTGGVVYGQRGSDGVALNLSDGSIRDAGSWTPPAAVLPSWAVLVPVPSSEREGYVAVSTP